MKILFRNLDPGAGGGVSSVYKLLEAYCQTFPSDRLTVMCTRDSPLAGLRQHNNATLEFVPSGATRELNRLAWASTGVHRQLKRAAYDLVWCMNVGPYVKTAVPQALSVHNAYQAYPWSLARHHPGWRVRVAALRWFFRRSLRCADAVIVQTGMMREYVRAIEGCPDCVAVLPKAVLSSPDDPGESISPRLASLLDKDSGLFTALYVAGDTPHKNHSLLASIMRICSERAIPVRLVVTLNSEEWSRAGGPSAKHLTGSGRVIPAGWIPKGQLRDLYTRVDWCVMPSLLESLSSSHLEAMQWGRPQVAADLPYARDLCGDAAVYADVRDPYSWVACLERLRSEPDLGTRLVAHGFARLKAFPATWTDMAERIRAIFLDVVKPVRPEERSDEEHVNAFR